MAITPRARTPTRCASGCLRHRRSRCGQRAGPRPRPPPASRSTSAAHAKARPSSAAHPSGWRHGSAPTAEAGTRHLALDFGETDSDLAARAIERFADEVVAAERAARTASAARAGTGTSRRAGGPHAHAAGRACGCGPRRARRWRPRTRPGCPRARLPRPAAAFGRCSRRAPGQIAGRCGERLPDRPRATSTMPLPLRGRGDRGR